VPGSKSSNEMAISSFTNNSMFLVLPPDADYLGGMLNISLYKCFSFGVLFLHLIMQAITLFTAIGFLIDNNQPQRRHCIVSKSYIILGDWLCQF
jgi:hypothetical protein